MERLYKEDGELAGYYDVINWFLSNYKGLEHLHNNPETMYSVITILERCLIKLKSAKEFDICEECEDFKNKEVKQEAMQSEARHSSQA